MDTLSRRTSLTRPNGINTTHSYNNVPNLLSVLHQLGTTTLDGASYTYHLAGNRKTRTDKRLGTTLTYAYDNIYQLLTAKQGTTTKESYTGACPERYSSREAMRVSRRNPVGNRLSSVGVNPYQYDPVPCRSILEALVWRKDRACMHHDICYYECRKGHPCSKADRAACMRRCDSTLMAEAPYSTMGNTVSWWVWNFNKDPNTGENDSSCPCERGKQKSIYPEREHFMSGW